jgi:PAS domain S-box-containing protein
MVDLHPVSSPSWPAALRTVPQPLGLGAGALVQALLAWAAMVYAPPVAPQAIFQPDHGWALALVLLGGPRYALAAGTGTLAAYALAGMSWSAALGAGLAHAAGVWTGWTLLARARPFDTRLPTVHHLGWLLVRAIAPAAALGAAILTLWLALLGQLSWPQWPQALVLEFMGATLGMVLVTPLVLIWVRQPLRLQSKRRWLETAAALLSAGLLGQLIFLAAAPGLLPAFTRHGYSLFGVVVWTAARLGRRAVLTTLALLTLQAVHGMQLNVGLFAGTNPLQQAFDGWGYLLTLTLVGLYLATTLYETRAANQALRVAATAFDCQEGIIVTDAQRRIVQANRSFTRITGYALTEVQGQTTDLLRTGPDADSICEQAWRTAAEQGHWKGEAWHRRKTGEVFPQWITITAVRNERGEITRFVVTHTDISERKQREAQQQAQQKQQRLALVREVHHRIKNHLQGLTGLLRQHTAVHPELAEPLQHAIAQIHSIAVIHGLQGHSPDAQVRLCELAPTIADSVATLWQAPVRIDRPADWVPCLVNEAEAVPLALILNELLTNAVKHAQPRERGIELRLRKGSRAEELLIRISNPGRWQPGAAPGSGGNGLALIEAMLPPQGAHIEREQADGWVHTTLRLQPPAITLERSNDESRSEPHQAAAAGR